MQLGALAWKPGQQLDLGELVIRQTLEPAVARVEPRRDPPSFGEVHGIAGTRGP
jgi:hypothetical protein